MQVIKNPKETGVGPKDWFTGLVYIDNIKDSSESFGLMVNSVHFTPGARTAWHTHPHGQTLYVTDGVGLVARRGGQIEIIRSGDVVHIEPNEEHWHGATAKHFMTHIAINDADDQGNLATWGKHVTDEEYNEQPEVE